MVPSPSRREPLDRERIVGAAVELADDEGVDALSMRKLAAQLGCGVMSLYNHVESKDDLLGLMIDAVVAGIDAPPPDAPPLLAIRELAVATREMFAAHSWVPGQWLRQVPGPARVDHMEQFLQLFDASDLAPELAHHGFHAVNNHVLGYTLQEREMATGVADLEATAAQFMAQLDPELHRHTAAHVQQHLDGDTSSSFELVLDLILDGLVRLGAPR